MIKCIEIAKAVLLFICAGFLCGFSGCFGPGENSASGGFPVGSFNEYHDLLGNIIFAAPKPHVTVSGTWLSDESSSAVGNVRAFTVVTDDDGFALVQDGRIYADWASDVDWGSPICGQNVDSAYFLNVDPVNGINWKCVQFVGTFLPTSTSFTLPSQLPQELTYQSPNIHATYGAPILDVFDPANASIISQTIASTTIDGSGATFPYPRVSGGAPLSAANMYALNVLNVGSDGSHQWAGTGFLAVGSETSVTTPFGVDAAVVTTKTTYCYLINRRNYCSTEPSVSTPYPVVTLYSTNQVSYRGSLIAVGAEPTAIRAFGSATSSSTQRSGGDTFTTVTTQPTGAVVANFGSSSVTLVSLPGHVAYATIAVGSEPCAIEVKPDASVAWVANYGSGTISELNLSTDALSRTATVGANPAALAYDSGRNALWVGGAGFIQELDLNSFASIQSIPVSGDVTSLAYSAGQNELVYSMISNGGAAFSPGSNPPTTSQASVQELRLSDNSVQGTYSSGSVNSYQANSIGGTLPAVTLLARGALVSANYSNAFAIVATPTGFSVLDIPGHQVFMQGTTPTPIRSIAVDPSQGVAYLTVPQSNELIQVPLPSL